MLVDAHCHIHDQEFFPDVRQEVYERARNEGITMICVGTNQSDSRAAVEFANQKAGTFAVVGVHPHDSKDGVAEIGEILAESPTNLVGIGEIGLDYFYNNSPRDTQIMALEQQLQWASDYKLPISFHVREAYQDFWPIFDNFSGLRGVLHSFTDTQASLEAALGRGLFIGVNGISTFTKDEAQKAMFESVPLSNMLLETDAPFLTPHPLRGKINQPAFVRYVAEYHAEIRQISLGDLADQTTANADELFKIFASKTNI